LVKWAVVDVDSSTPHEKQKSETGEERRALLGLVEISIQKETHCQQTVSLLEMSLVEIMQSLDPQETSKTLLK